MILKLPAWSDAATIYRCEARHLPARHLRINAVRACVLIGLVPSGAQD